MSKKRLNIQLATDEKVRHKYKFSYSPIFYFLKSYFWITNKRLIINHPSVFFFIPISSNTVTFTLRNIGGVRNKNKLSSLIAIGSTFAYLFAFALFGQGNFAPGFLCLATGFIATYNTLRTFIAVSASSGEAEQFYYVPWELNIAKKMIRELDRVIAEI